MILVTGAAGFIGKHLIKGLLAQNEHDIICIDIADMTGLPLAKPRRQEIDITDDKAMSWLAGNLKHMQVEACVHLAAVASPPIAQREPERAWATNVRGTHNVLKLCHEIQCPRVVFFSSAHVYGISPKYMPTDEQHPLALHDTYTTTKILGEQLCQLFYENHGLAYTTLRLWNAYGPGQSPDYFIGKKISQARVGDITIRNAAVTKDWVHVRDVIRAVLMAIKSDYVGPLNIGTGVETSLTEIINLIAQKFGRQIFPEDAPDEGPTRMLCDYRRAHRILGWEPTIKFSDGLAELMNPE